MPTTVFGYSQSSIISTAARRLPNPGSHPKPEIPTGLRTDHLRGHRQRGEPQRRVPVAFPDLNLPALGIPFYGAAPEDEYPTISYAREYDGFADYPRYPMNFLSVLNAAFGIVYVHPVRAKPEKCTSFCLTMEEVEGRDRAADHRSDAAVLFHSPPRTCPAAADPGHPADRQSDRRPDPARP